MTIHLACGGLVLETIASVSSAPDNRGPWRTHHGILMQNSNVLVHGACECFVGIPNFNVPVNSTQLQNTHHSFRGNDNGLILQSMEVIWWEVSLKEHRI